MPWPTEKSFKPIAYYHPYMIAGQKGCLQYLRNLGFETFDNMFDESYDLLENYNDRINLIAQNVKEFCQLLKKEKLNLLQRPKEKTETRIAMILAMFRWISVLKMK